MTFWFIIGTAAALLTTFGFVPQILKMRSTKSSKDVSIITLFQYSAGVFLWTLYGLHLGDIILIIANVVSLLILAIAIAMHYQYQRLNAKS